VNIGGSYYGATNYGTGFVGFNIGGGPTSFSTGADGANNGAGMIHSTIGGSIKFSTFPSTGSSQQSLTQTDVINNVRMIIQGGGNVGIGTTNPISKLDIAGQTRSVNSSGAAQVNGSAAIDWNNGNAQSMSVDCATTSFTNMLDGGTYILAVSETGTSTCVFSQAGLTFYFSPANGARTAGQRTVYSFQRIGSDVYVSWVKGFQ